MSKKNRGQLKTNHVQDESPFLPEVQDVLEDHRERNAAVAEILADSVAAPMPEYSEEAGEALVKAFEPEPVAEPQPEPQTEEPQPAPAPVETPVEATQEPPQVVEEPTEPVAEKSDPAPTVVVPSVYVYSEVLDNPSKAPSEFLATCYTEAYAALKKIQASIKSTEGPVGTLASEEKELQAKIDHLYSTMIYRTGGKAVKLNWRDSDVVRYCKTGLEPTYTATGGIKGDRRFMKTPVASWTNNQVRDVFAEDHSGMRKEVTQRMRKLQVPTLGTAVAYSVTHAELFKFVTKGVKPQVTPTDGILVNSIKRNEYTEPKHWTIVELKALALGEITNQSAVPDRLLQPYMKARLYRPGITNTALVTYLKNGVEPATTSFGELVDDTCRDATPVSLWSHQQLLSWVHDEIPTPGGVNEQSIIKTLKEVFYMNDRPDEVVKEEVKLVDEVIVKPELHFVRDAIRSYRNTMETNGNLTQDQAARAQERLLELLRKLLTSDYAVFVRGYQELLDTVAKTRQGMFSEASAFRGLSMMRGNQASLTMFEQMVYLMMTTCDAEHRKANWENYNPKTLFEAMPDSKAQENLANFYAQF